MSAGESVAPGSSSTISGSTISGSPISSSTIQASNAPVDRRGEKAMRSELLDSERIVVASRQHIIRLLSPTLGLLTGFVLMLLIGVLTPASLGFFSDTALRIWLLMLLYYLYVLISWSHDWFVATDRRLLLRYGLIHRRTAMMPLSKVTDLTFERSPAGRLIGYGTFVLESAGQDQALHRITYVRRPSATYHAICEEIFGRRKRSSGMPSEASPVQTGGIVGSAIDDTDVPLHRLGAYLDRSQGRAHSPNREHSQSREHDRRAQHVPDRHEKSKHKGPLRERLLRGPQPMESFGSRTSMLTDAGDQRRSWEVSHEDASPHQPVDRRRDEE